MLLRHRLTLVRAIVGICDPDFGMRATWVETAEASYQELVQTMQLLLIANIIRVTYGNFRNEISGEENLLFFLSNELAKHRFDNNKNSSSLKTSAILQ